MTLGRRWRCELKEDHSVREEGVERSRMESPETEPPPPESAARSPDAA